jgi:hypothetical protein
MYPRACFAVLLIACAADPLPEKEDAAVRAVVEGAFRDSAKKDWASYAKRLDPAGLKTFRDDWVEVLKNAAKAGREKELLALFSGAPDTKTLLGYTPEEFFARFMKGALASAPPPPAGKAKVLGVVAEGPDLAHVVVRGTRKVPGAGKGAVEVVTVRKAGGVWKAELPKELVMVAATLRLSGAVDTQKATDTNGV